MRGQCRTILSHNTPESLQISLALPPQVAAGHAGHDTLDPLKGPSYDARFDFLPGRIHLQRGAPSDYRTLERFHYVPRRPATWALVYRAVYQPTTLEATTDTSARLIGVAVLSWPVPTCKPRERYFHSRQASYGHRLRFANAHLRTISRVVVHPQFRAIGLATALIDCLLYHCPTRYVEAMAVMARVHPLFQSAGMTLVPPEDPEPYAYYIRDREALSQEGQTRFP